MKTRVDELYAEAIRSLNSFIATGGRVMGYWQKAHDRLRECGVSLKRVPRTIEGAELLLEHLASMMPER